MCRRPCMAIVVSTSHFTGQYISKPLTATSTMLHQYLTPLSTSSNEEHSPWISLRNPLATTDTKHDTSDHSTKNIGNGMALTESVAPSRLSEQPLRRKHGAQCSGRSDFCSGSECRRLESSPPPPCREPHRRQPYGAVSKPQWSTAVVLSAQGLMPRMLRVYPGNQAVVAEMVKGLAPQRRTRRADQWTSSGRRRTGSCSEHTPRCVPSTGMKSGVLL